MDLAALRELAEKATPGPWYQPTNPHVMAGVHARGYGVLASTWGRNLYANAPYLAAVSPEVVLALCDVAEALERIANPPEVLHGYANELVRLARETLARLEELPVK